MTRTRVLYTSNIPEGTNATVVTVCIGEEVAAMLARVFEERLWRVSFSSFDAYLSPSRRPSFGPQSKSSGSYIAFVDFDQNAEQAAETCRYLSQIFAGKVTLIALAKSNAPASLLATMRSGCSEFLHKPVSELALSGVMDHLERNSAASLDHAASSGAVISFFGAKGGVGTTTLAVHLATYLVQCHKKRALLIDYHPELGHICIYLGLDGSHYHFHEVVRNVNRLDSELLKGFVVKHASGLDVLSSPDICGASRLFEPESVVRTLDFLRSEYDYVILDCSSGFDELNQPVMNLSSYIYLVATPEVSAIRDLSRRVDKFMLFDSFSEKLRVVINRCSSMDSIHTEQIEKAIKLPVAINIPNNYAEIMKAENLGEPIPCRSKSEISDRLIKWTNSLVGSSRNLSADKSDKTDKADKKEKKDKRSFALWK